MPHSADGLLRRQARLLAERVVWVPLGRSVPPGRMYEVPEKYELARRAIESGLWLLIESDLPYRASAGTDGRFDVITF